MLQTADRGLGEMAYDASHATALLPLYIEIVATASQLVDTLLYLYKIRMFECSFIFIKNQGSYEQCSRFYKYQYVSISVGEIILMGIACPYFK